MNKEIVIDLNDAKKLNLIVDFNTKERLLNIFKEKNGGTQNGQTN